MKVVDGNGNEVAAEIHPPACTEDAPIDAALVEECLKKVRTSDPETAYRVRSALNRYVLLGEMAKMGRGHGMVKLGYLRVSVRIEIERMADRLRVYAGSLGLWVPKVGDPRRTSVF